MLSFSIIVLYDLCTWTSFKDSQKGTFILQLDTLFIRKLVFLEGT